jgi:uncharacterized protein (TIRG00374 family)
MPRLLIVIILIMAIALVVFSFSELQEITKTFQQAHPGFIALAVLIQAVWFFVLGGIFQTIYAALGLKESKRRLTLLAPAGIFVSIVTPSAGVGGLAVLLADAKQRGHPSGKVTVAGALYLLLDEASFLCVLAVGIAVLIRRNHLHAGEISAALILLAVACCLTFLLLLAYRSPAALGRALARAARVINTLVRPFIRRDYLSEARAHDFAAEVSEGLGSLPASPNNLLRPFLLSLANKVLMMGILVCSFLSFDVPFTAGTIVGGFAIGYLFLIVSPTPSGVGVVEGVMPLALSTLGVNFSEAVIITLAYRGVTFWLPLAVGALALRFLNLQGAKSKTLHPSAQEE